VIAVLDLTCSSDGDPLYPTADLTVGDVRETISRALLGEEAATVCRHCGAEITRCPEEPVVGLFCKGWKHAEFVAAKPIGAHYCGGRSVNPVAEPVADGEESGDVPAH
jgi:hypothetical protein